MKHIRVFLVAAFVGLAAVNSTAQVTVIDGGFCGADPPIGQNLTWYLYSDSTLIIYGSGDMEDFMSAVEPKRPWEKCYPLIKTLIIGDSVTGIGGSTFSDGLHGTALTTVIIGKSVTNIRVGAFSRCSALTSITIPENVTSIENGTFEYCSSLTSVSIGSGVTNIGRWAFRYCYRLTAITCRAVTPPVLGSDVFYNTPKTASVYVPCGTIPAYQTEWGYFSNFVEEFADTTFIFDAICEGETYKENGFNEYEAGTYEQKQQNIHGCDSIIVLNLTVYPKQDTVIFNDTVLYGADYAQNGFTIINATKDSVYFNNNLNINGCDSVTQLILKITGVGIFEVTSYELQIVSYEIYDMLGRKLLSLSSPQAPFNSPEGGKCSPPSEGLGEALPAGTYIIRMKTNNGIITKKIIKY